MFFRRLILSLNYNILYAISGTGKRLATYREETFLIPLPDSRERGYTDYAPHSRRNAMPCSPDKTDIAEIVSGGASGTDAMAERYAHEHGYSLQIFPAD